MIPLYRTILYATDLSANAAHAFSHAVALSRLHGATIHILHVLPEMETAVLNYVATVMGEEKLTHLEMSHKEEIRAQIRERISAFARQELNDHPEDLARIGEIDVRFGHPVARILEEADRFAADLIVIGSHGKGPLKYAFLGSVAEKLLRKTHRPVLVVPLGE